MSKLQQHSLTNKTVLEACKALQSKIHFCESMAVQCEKHGSDAGARHFWQSERENAATALYELTGV